MAASLVGGGGRGGEEETGRCKLAVVWLSFGRRSGVGSVN